jgi:hypothetical protein
MLCIIRSKACKRCGGDLSLECDIYGVYIECIQCGATWHQKDLALLKTQSKAKPSPGTAGPVTGRIAPAEPNPQPTGYSKVARQAASRPSISNP